MSDNLTAETIAAPSGMEDWIGSDMDSRRTVQLSRAFNGVIVRAYDMSRDTYGPELVFQDMEKLTDWLCHWHQTTSMGAKR